MRSKHLRLLCSAMTAFLKSGTSVPYIYGIKISGVRLHRLQILRYCLIIDVLLCHDLLEQNANFRRKYLQDHIQVNFTSHTIVDLTLWSIVIRKFRSIMQTITSSNLGVIISTRAIITLSNILYSPNRRLQPNLSRCKCPC